MEVESILQSFGAGVVTDCAHPAQVLSSRGADSIWVPVWAPRVSNRHRTVVGHSLSLTLKGPASCLGECSAHGRDVDRLELFFRPAV